MGAHQIPPICYVTGEDAYECTCDEHRCALCGQSQAGCACYDEDDEADQMLDVEREEMD